MIHKLVIDLKKSTPGQIGNVQSWLKNKPAWGVKVTPEGTMKLSFSSTKIKDEFMSLFAPGKGAIIIPGRKEIFLTI